ncbi:MAG TPA: hypothetical protein VFM90_03420, partial [Cyclobacteriaceae bacterium]|nr:hypothetical protein [Cyclobacteriaceae bacterium]
GGIESWPAAVAVTASGVELSISLTDAVDGDGAPVEITNLTGLGVRFNNVDATSTDAKFFIDNVTLVNDGGSTALYDFEQTGEWGFQVEWANASGLTISDTWSAQGNYALSATRQLVAGDNNIVFQVYPSDGILLGEVSTMKITAYAIDAGPNTTAHIFWKSPTGDESWPTGVLVGATGVELSIDVSTVSELSGFGVRFENADNLTTPSQFLIDNIVFE